MKINLQFNCLSSEYCHCKIDHCQLSRITPVSSQVLTVFHSSTPVNITMDSGATTSFITAKLCEQLDIPIRPNGQLARLGDGCTMIASLGEIDVSFTRAKWTVKFKAIVVEKLNTDIYGGMNFMIDNDITMRPKTGEIKVLNKYTVFQTNMIMPPPQLKSVSISSTTVPLNFRQTIFPSQQNLWKETNALGNAPSPPSLASKEKHSEESSLNVILPPEFEKDKFVVVCSRMENKNKTWPFTQTCPVDGGSISISNTSDKPISIPNDVHLLDVYHTEMVQVHKLELDSKHIHESDRENICNFNNAETLQEKGLLNAKNIDVTRAPKHLQEKLKQAHIQFSDVFAPDLSTGYNGHSGTHQVKLRFADEDRPQMSKSHVPKWSGKHDDMKQRKMDSLEEQNVLIDPYKHNIPIKLISPSFLRLKARAKGKEMEDCDLSEIRWIISPAQLNPHLKQLFTNTVSKEDLFSFKAEKPHCVEFDLYEGYFQNHLHKEDWGYLAVETPYKGLRILTRSGQGLLNQEIEMNQLLTKVLGEEIAKNNVVLQADDGQVGGKTEEEAIDNWISVLKLCSLNNLKINSKKVKILPESSLIHGWLFKDGHVEPSPHRALAILDMKPPKTVGELRTYMGVYKTFFPAMKRLSNLMDPFDKLCAGRKSKEALDWNETIDKHFKETQQVAQTDIKKLALPHPDEQLFIVPDAASRPPAIGFILFVQRDPPEPVMFVTWKLPESHWGWSPCELEGFGASVAVAKCSFYILKSTKPTLVFPDNKQVIQAFNKLQKGRYSTSQRLATFSNHMQKYPIQMQHGSGKMLQNLGSDYISRNAAECTNEGCELCKFAKDKGDSLLANITSKIFGNTIDSEIDLSSLSQHWSVALQGLDIPIGNLVAWSKVQSNDDSINKAIAYRKSGQTPPKSDKLLDMTEIRHYVSNCKYNSSNDLLIKEEDIPFDHKKKEKIVVPKWFIKPLLVQMHMDQTCPEPTQLKKIFERYFYGFRVSNLFQEVSEECPRCQARKKFPKELKHFTSITNSSSPGEIFVSDIMRRSKQVIFVTRDSFSDFVTTSIIKSEKTEDLKDGLITTTNTVRKQSEITVRVDNAPGFQSLFKSKDKDLAKLKIKLNLSNEKNKNGLAIVDKAIQELEKEITISSPEGKEISTTDLAKATMTLNSRIRNRNMSSHEILFSREQISGENLQLDDQDLQTKKLDKKLENHQYSEKSKYPNNKEPLDAKAKKGNLVHLKEDGDKHHLREKYLVIDSNETEVNIVKLLHSIDDNLQTKLSSKVYKVKQTEIYQACPNQGEKLETNKDTFEEVENVPNKPYIKEKENTTTHIESEAPVVNNWTPFPTTNDSSDEDSSEVESEAEDEESSTTDEESDDNSIGATAAIDDYDSRSEREDNSTTSVTDEYNENNKSTTASAPESLDEEAGIAVAEIEEPDELNLDIEAEAAVVDVEEADELFDSELSNPTAKPIPGDRIAYIDFAVQPPRLIHATISLMYRTVQKKYPGWFNVLREDGSQGSIRLDDRRWRFVIDETEGVVQDVQDVEEENSHDDAFAEETPLHNHLPTPFPEVQNLNNVLPLTSTPEELHPPKPPRQRLSDVRPRGLLPMAFEDSPLASTLTPSRFRRRRLDSSESDDGGA